jgi:hypothetical protein
MLSVIKNLSLRTHQIYTIYGLELALAQYWNHPQINVNYQAVIQTKQTLYNESFAMCVEANTRSKLIDCIRDPHQILIYTPAKVGSRTIEYSLSSINKNNLIIHHFMHFIAQHANDHKEIISYYRNLISELDHLQIITLVREPIARDLANFFQCNFAIYKQRDLRGPFLDCCINEMKRVAFEWYDDSRYGYQFEWFNQELKAVYGIDVYDHPFDKGKGYAIIRKDNIELLIMKLEKLDKLESIIGKFVDVPNFKLINTNMSEGKTYKYLYQNVRDAILIPQEIISLYYENNPYIDHFYTEEEKAEFLKKWKRS